MKVLFLSKYSRLGGSSRFMIYDYLEFLNQANIKTEVSPLFDERYHQRFGEFEHHKTLSNIIKHCRYYIQCAIKRLWHVLQSCEYDIVVLEKELIPFLPYGIEKLLKIRGTKLITLYDDAIHARYASYPNRGIQLICNRKIDQIVRLSDHVIVWNNNLAVWARQLNSNITVLNTGVDLRRYRLKSDEEGNKSGKIVLGWIGTPSSYEYIRELEDVFKNLSSRYGIELCIVSSRDYQSINIKVDNRRWSLATEVDDLCSFDIGIMPLPDDEWTRCKSGCKAVQYLAVGIPAVCSPIGAATEIISDGVNGYLAKTPSEWISKLAWLIENPALRSEMGARGRAMVINKYSIQSVAPSLIATLKSVGHC
jgi:glycosyltransferase involved in cell wall biosynthesis